MLVTLKKMEYTFSEIVEGKKAIIIFDELGYARIRGSELQRLGVPREVLGDDLTFSFHLFRSEYEPVQREFQDCSESNVGEGWEGFYEQAPIKKSKFRNR